MRISLDFKIKQINSKKEKKRKEKNYPPMYLPMKQKRKAFWNGSHGQKRQNKETATQKSE